MVKWAHLIESVCIQFLSCQIQRLFGILLSGLTGIVIYKVCWITKIDVFIVTNGVVSVNFSILLFFSIWFSLAFLIDGLNRWVLLCRLHRQYLLVLLAHLHFILPYTTFGNTWFSLIISNRHLKFILIRTHRTSTTHSTSWHLLGNIIFTVIRHR